MSSIQAYKAHKQEGTIAATTLVARCTIANKEHSAHLHKHLYISGCMIIVGHANVFKVTTK